MWRKLEGKAGTGGEELSGKELDSAAVSISLASKVPGLASKALTGFFFFLFFLESGVFIWVVVVTRQLMD